LGGEQRRISPQFAINADSWINEDSILLDQT